jgi:hypothetical protein
MVVRMIAPDLTRALSVLFSFCSRLLFFTRWAGCLSIMGW